MNIFRLGLILLFLLTLMPGLTVALDNIRIGSDGRIYHTESGDPDRASNLGSDSSTDKLQFIPVYQFGDVWEGTIVEHEFQVRNQSGETVQILSVMPSCGCTATIVSNTRIGEGEVTSIKASLNTLNREGRISKAINIRTNLDGYEQINLRMEGEVRPIVTVEPRYIPLGRINPNESQQFEITVTLAPQRTEQFQIEKVEAVADYVSFTINQQERTWKVLATLDTELLKRRAERERIQAQDQEIPITDYLFQGIIRIHTNLDIPGKRILYVRFNGEMAL